MAPEFFHTRMAQKFFEHDVPRIANVLERVGKALEQLAVLEETYQRYLIDRDKEVEKKIKVKGGEIN